MTASIDESLPWREQLASGPRQFRALLLAHRDVAQLLRERPPTGPNRLGRIETTVGILLRAGFGEDDAAGISRLLTAHVLSSVEPSRRATEPGSDAGRALFDRMAGYPHLPPGRARVRAPVR